MDSSIGSPRRSAPILSTNRRSNSSATASWTMNRLAAMQLCPLFWHPGDDGDFGRLVEVGRREHDKRVAAAEFQDRLLDLLAGHPGHGLAGRGAPGQGGGGDPRVAQDPLDQVGPDEQRLEDAVREPGPAEEILHEQRRLGDVGGVLEQADVAGHEGRGGEAHGLPQREVPGHDGEDGPDRQVAGVGLLGADGARIDRLVGQERLGVLGIEPAGLGALQGLGLRRLQGLAHLRRHDRGDGIGFLVQDVGRRLQPPGPLGEGGQPVALEGRIRPGELGVELLDRERIKRLDRLPGRRIHSGDGHWSLPDQPGWQFLAQCSIPPAARPPSPWHPLRMARRPRPGVK